MTPGFRLYVLGACYFNPGLHVFIYIAELQISVLIVLSF